MFEMPEKGQLLMVKAPPYYTREYPYEVTGSGSKIVRAALRGSPKVRKSWTIEEFATLMDLGIIRLVSADDY